MRTTLHGFGRQSTGPARAFGDPMGHDAIWRVRSGNRASPPFPTEISAFLTLSGLLDARLQHHYIPSKKIYILILKISNRSCKGADTVGKVRLQGSQADSSGSGVIGPQPRLVTPVYREVAAVVRNDCLPRTMHRNVRSLSARPRDASREAN